MNEITIDKNAKQITFTNNGIGFSQFGIANEILDLIENQTKEIERLNNIINEFERLLQQDLENEKDTYWTNITKEDYIQFMLNKLQELKGSESNE